MNCNIKIEACLESMLLWLWRNHGHLKSNYRWFILNTYFVCKRVKLFRAYERVDQQYKECLMRSTNGSIRSFRTPFPAVCRSSHLCFTVNVNDGDKNKHKAVLRFPNECVTHSSCHPMILQSFRPLTTTMCSNFLRYDGRTKSMREISE
ncbi:hypothetical protein GCK32_007674 [Trichostrongylus colubriformis]|uniref:Uncharacterized protein n=1 Tax=Trichostrongylus colubriformis TaxID=6319 RepID=A0AAN8FT31_TRICO